MTFEEALGYIKDTSKYGSKLGLDSIRYLLDLLGNPHEDLRVIHIAGTNGKGSTAAFIESILKEEGYINGVFSSPYIENITEMIRINGEEIPHKDFGEITEIIRERINIMLDKGKEHPTEFEILTAMALLFFKKRDVDFVILEVGLGGRLDSTNIVDKPLVSVITSISLDHINILGDNLQDIAREKAGIIKKNIPVVTWPQKEEAQRVIENTALESNSILYNAPLQNIKINNCSKYGTIFNVDILDKSYNNVKISILGTHQAKNSVVALTTIQVLINHYKLKVSKESIYQGLEKARWAGRLEILDKDPTLIIDGAHNLEGAKVLRESIEILNYEKLICVIGVLADKNVEGILDEIIPPCDTVIVTTPNNSRRLPVNKLRNKISKYNKVIISCEEIEEAVTKSLELANPNDLVLYCGSLYLIGKVRIIINNMCS